jgi:pyruvate dehydrogenase E2 component (dihydrolipoamide acetyltransferase)
MKDGTITLSNLGAAGIETGTAIINPPQSTIVFVGAIRKVPVVDEKNEIVVGRLLQLSITYDHRFIDGTTASRFTNAVKAEIEAASRDRLEHIPSNA